MSLTFTPTTPIWCAGCGDFAVRAALLRALHARGIAPHDTMILAGIGCSGTIQNTVHAYGFHALHGRVLPTATGVALANPALTVVAAGGDGDGYAIGAGHLIHAFRRDPPFVYLLMNNGTYGLTKGQPSPTTPQLDRDSHEGFDALLTGLSIPSTTFLARAYCGWVDQLEQLIEEALRHAAERRGFAFLEIISPCVTYRDVYPTIESRLVDVEAAHDRHDRAGAFVRALEADGEDRIPVGLIYEAPGDGTVAAGPGPIGAELDPSRQRNEYAEIMQAHAV